MTLHREGTKIVLGSLIVLGGLCALIWWKAPALGWWFTVPAFAFWGLILQFFRNPDRSIAQRDERLVYAPADGKIVAIEVTQEPEYFKADRLQVSIFMSPLNVHVNRAPFSGSILYSKYHPGTYLAAWHPKSSTENERTSVVIKGQHGTVLLRQIAGAVARRILYYVKKGDHIRQGDEFGFIRFGSRVDLFLPLDAEIQVQLDQKVRGNRTVIAILRPETQDLRRKT